MRRAARDQGASSVEYGLLVVLIAAVIVTAVFALGGLTKGLFDTTCISYASKATSTSVSCK